MKIIKTLSLFLLATMLVFQSCRSYSRSAILHWGKPAAVGMDPVKLAKIDDLINEEIAAGHLPGAVLMVARKGAVVIRKAYGNAQVYPDTIPMTPGKMFDMASLTKPVATATAIMILVERGQLRLMDPVEKFIPEYTRYIYEDGSPAEPIRLYHLLTHTSGLPPYTDFKALKSEFGAPCPEAVIHRIATIEKQNPPGLHFAYSCLGFITLGEIIRRVTGMDIDEFTVKNIFKPLNMQSTMFTPPEKYFSRIAPTEIVNGVPLKGFVHDPLARLMGGLSGNAGLFSSADDLAIFAQMMLNKGEFNGVRILSPLTVERMTEVYPLVKFSGRGLGWDLDSDYSTNGGDLFGAKSFGHSGYTGTSLWIDPETETVVIFLTNRVHPNDGGSVVPIRSKVANIVAGAILEDVK